MPIAISVLNLPSPPRSPAIVSGGIKARTAELRRRAMEKYFIMYIELATISCVSVFSADRRKELIPGCSRYNRVKTFVVRNPPPTASRKAATVRAMAMLILICVAVRKKIVGFISGEERMNAITALNGSPVVIRERPMGTAAYVGNGEASPTRAATMMERNSLEVGLSSFL